MNRLLSEWYIGKDNKIFATFTTLEAGEAWLRANYTVADMAAVDEKSVDEFIDACFNELVYFSWETIKIIK